MIDPMLMLILVTSLVSAFNPYTMGVLILLSSVIYGRGHASPRVFRLGLVYIATLFALTLLGGIGMLYAFSLLPLVAAHYLTLGIGILVVCAGLLEIKDFFWYGQGISSNTPTMAARNIKSLTKGRPGVLSAAMLGLFVAVVTAPAASAPYFTTITILSGPFDARAVGLLALYSALFILPMLVMLVSIACGVRVSTWLHWREETKGTMRLGVGLLLIALGWIVILMTSGVLNFT